MYDYVIVGAGSAGCVLAARLSEDPDVKVAILEAGGQDNKPEISMPAAFPMLLKSSVDWDLLRRAGAGPRRPPALPAARQGTRRVRVDQRDDLPPRQSRRLRRVGGWRRRRVELRGGSAVLQALGGQRPGRGRVPRRRRAAERVRQSIDGSDDRDDHRGMPARRARAQPRLQRRSSGGSRTLPEHPAQRTAPLDRGSLPAPGRSAAQPRRDHRRDGVAHPLRRLARQRASRLPGTTRSRRSTPDAR